MHLFASFHLGSYLGLDTRISFDFSERWHITGEGMRPASKWRREMIRIGCIFYVKRIACLLFLVAWQSVFDRDVRIAWLAVAMFVG